MNNTFNYRRFSLLIKRQWIENKKLFLMASGIILGLGAVCYLLSMDLVTGRINSSIQVALFVIGIIISGTIFTSFLFKDLSDKNSTTSYLQIPASHFEKLSTAILYSFIVFPLAYILIFNVLDFLMVNTSNSITSNYLATNIHGKVDKSTLLFGRIFNQNESRRTFSPDSVFSFNAYDFLAVWFLPVSFLILGSIFYSRSSLVKTIFTGLVILFSIYFIYDFVYGILVESLSNYLSGTANRQIEPTAKMLVNTTWSVLKYIITPMLLLIAYFKLKEKQV